MNTRWSSRLSHFICGCSSVCLQQWQMQFVLSVSFERCIRQNAPHTQLCLVNLVFSQLIVSQLDGSSKKGKFARVSLACSSAPQLPRKHRRRSAPQHGSRLSLSASSKTHRSVGPMLLIVGEAAQLCSRQVSPFSACHRQLFPLGQSSTHSSEAERLRERLRAHRATSGTVHKVRAEACEEEERSYRELRTLSRTFNMAMCWTWHIL